MRYRPKKQHLLKDGDLLKRNLDAHIAARDHNAVADAQDVVDVANALGVFDLCNDADFFIALTLQNLTDLKDIVGAAHKRSGDKIESICQCRMSASATARIS